jgi:hypothetical protein
MAPSGFTGWSAGGGGSREIITDIRDNSIPSGVYPVQATLLDYIHQYWIYGAAAFVGLVALKKLRTE